MLALWFNFWPSNYGSWPPAVQPTLVAVNSVRPGVDMLGVDEEVETRAGVQPMPLSV